MIRFVGEHYYPMLYESKPVEKKVEWLSGERVYQIIVLGYMHGPASMQNLTMGIHVLDSGQVVARRSINMERRDLFSLFRAMNLVMALPCISQYTLADACYTSRIDINPVDKKRLERVYQLIGESHYQKVMSLLPLELERCVSILTQNGIRTDIQYYKNEILSGRLNMEPWLSSVLSITEVGKNINQLVYFFREPVDHFIKSNTTAKSALALALEYYLSQILSQDEYKNLDGDLVFILAIILAKFSTAVYRMKTGGPGEPEERLKSYEQFVDKTLFYMRSLPISLKLMLGKGGRSSYNGEYKQILRPWLVKIAYDERIHLVKF